MIEQVPAATSYPVASKNFIRLKLQAHAIFSSRFGVAEPHEQASAVARAAR